MLIPAVACNTAKFIWNPFSEFIYPTNRLTGIPDDKSMVRYILCHNSAGADKCVFANCNLTDDGAIRVQCRPLPDNCSGFNNVWRRGFIHTAGVDNQSRMLFELLIIELIMVSHKQDTVKRSYCIRRQLNTR